MIEKYSKLKIHLLYSLYNYIVLDVESVEVSCMFKQHLP